MTGCWVEDCLAGCTACTGYSFSLRPRPGMMRCLTPRSAWSPQLAASLVQTDHCSFMLQDVRSHIKENTRSQNIGAERFREGVLTWEVSMRGCLGVDCWVAGCSSAAAAAVSSCSAAAVGDCNSAAVGDCNSAAAGGYSCAVGVDCRTAAPEVGCNFGPRRLRNCRRHRHSWRRRRRRPHHRRHLPSLHPLRLRHLPSLHPLRPPPPSASAAAPSSA